MGIMLFISRDNIWTSYRGFTMKYAASHALFIEEQVEEIEKEFAEFIDKAICEVIII